MDITGNIHELMAKVDADLSAKEQKELTWENYKSPDEQNAVQILKLREFRANLIKLKVKNEVSNQGYLALNEDLDADHQDFNNC